MVAETGDDQGMVALPEPLQRRQIHMVVMVMADEDQVDVRKSLEGDSWPAHPPRADKREGRRPLGPDRIGEDVEAVHLDEDGGMANPGDEHRSGILQRL